MSDCVCMRACVHRHEWAHMCEHGICVEIRGQLVGGHFSFPRESSRCWPQIIQLSPTSHIAGLKTSCTHLSMRCDWCSGPDGLRPPWWHHTVPCFCQFLVGLLLLSLKKKKSNKFSFRSGWPQIYHLAKDDIELLIFLPPPVKAGITALSH